MRRRPSLIVEKIVKGRLGETMGVQPGDRLVEMNAHPIRDLVDYRFYSADEVLDCTFLRGNALKRIQFRRKEWENLGLEFEPMRFKKCGNHCIFCFIDQNPGGLRKSLYFKDEDYRLSFLYGNYVTLTRVDRWDLERIVEQRLSPLYVSIHATDSEIRKALLGLKREDHLLEKIRFLVENTIELHGQIVLCPGINDGEVLQESLETLSPFFPRLRSVAVVPVGLTRHRRGLKRLKGYDSRSAAGVLEMVGKFQDRYGRELGEPFVYLADEFYLLAGVPLPSLEHYGDFWQIENGVGMTRSFLAEFNEASRGFPKKLARPRRYAVVTGTLAGTVVEENLLPTLRQIENLHVDVCVVPNRFYGESVTVSGLLTGRDILDAFKGEKDDSALLLPPNCLNGEGLFLDDFSTEDLAQELGRSIYVCNDFKDLF